MANPSIDDDRRPEPAPSTGRAAPTPCACCGATERAHFAEVGDYRYVSCLRCGFVFLAPMPHEDELLAYYQHDRGITEHYYPKSRSRRRKASWKVLSLYGYIARRRVLDVGCGGGFMTDALRRFAASAVGVDVNAQAIAYARRHFPACSFHVVRELGAFANERKAAFDFVYCSEVLEHVADPNALLAAIAELLAPDGRLLLTTPDLGSPRRPANVLDWDVFSPPEHVQFFTQSTLSALLARHGLAIGTVLRDTKTGLKVLAAKRGEPGADAVRAAASGAADGAPRVPALRFHLHAWRKDATNFSMFRHRYGAGRLVSMPQSGTHWVKYMMGIALSQTFGVPAPKYNHANELIRGTHDPCVYPQLPALISSHSIPHPLLALAPVRAALGQPRAVVLLRSIEAALVSNFEKWKERYGVGFSEYLRGDVSGRRYTSDLWNFIRFYNRWGDLAARYPTEVKIVRYEDLVADPPAGLHAIFRFFDIPVGHAAVDAAVSAATKDRMRNVEDPSRTHSAISLEQRDVRDWFSPEDRAFVEAAYQRLRRHRFGYPLAWAGVDDAR